MDAKALSYQLKVQDYFKGQPSIWEYFSSPGDTELEITGRIVTAIINFGRHGSAEWQTARNFRHCNETPGAVIKIQGPQELGNLDLFDQAEIRDLTRVLIRELLRPDWMRTEAVVAIAREYFADLGWEEEEWRPEPLDGVHGSIRDYMAFVLLDLVLADPVLKERAAERARSFAGWLGLADSFEHIYNYGKPNQDPL